MIFCFVFKGKIVVVTGGASGLGRGTVNTLLNAGAKIAIVDLPTSKGAEIAEELGENVIFAPANVVSDEDVQAAFQRVKECFGRCDAVVHCAGITKAFKLYNAAENKMADPESIREIIDTNVIGTFNIARHAVALMCENEKNEGQRGVVVNVSSIAAFDGPPTQSAYAASKGAIAAMTLPLARDHAQDGIRFMAIAAGIFDTPMTAKYAEQVKRLPIPNPSRMGSPEEFGHLVKHIIENRYLNGEVIRIDAAMRLPR
ncbi:unnamed protein product [Heligmosomoides polygyrus]|uniref:3-hydroxyacyl-CoA dehydrogenase type-2 n=1 Tax=Heligmosomoides polygyrus TaxID=6339 RepID=A0A183FVT7_HELPZ|nr:unnamed protein product [Heligmosomoides polygyrus]